MKYIACLFAVLFSAFFCASAANAGPPQRSSGVQQQAPPGNFAVGAGRSTEKTYDSAGHMQGKTVVDGNTVKAYDSRGHLQGKVVVDGDTTKVYDSAGHLESKTVVDGNSVKSYDSRGRLEGKVVDDGNVRKIYDGSGRLLEKTVIEGAPSHTRGAFHHQKHMHAMPAFPVPSHPVAPGQYQEQHEKIQESYRRSPHSSGQYQSAPEIGPTYDFVGGQLRARPQAGDVRLQPSHQRDSGQYQSKPDFTARQMEDSRIRVRHLPDGSVLITNE